MTTYYNNGTGQTWTDDTPDPTPPPEPTATAQVTVDTHAVDAAMIRAEKATTVAGLRAAVVDLARAIGTD